MKTKCLAVGIILLFVAIAYAPAINAYEESRLPKTLSIPDQEDQTQTNYTHNAQLIFDKIYAAQEFKPTLRMLTRVFLFLGKDGNPPDDLIVSIRFNLTETDTLHVSIPKESIPEFHEIKWIEVNFQDIIVEPYKSYYIVLRTTGGDSNNSYWFGFGTGNPYPDGQAYWSESNGSEWEIINNSDFCFKTYGYNFSTFFLSYGLVITHSTIDYTYHDNFSRYNYFTCFNVSRVTVIGLGNYLPTNSLRFYMKTFTNVSVLSGGLLRKIELSDEYKHFIIFPAPPRPCIFSTYKK